MSSQMMADDGFAGAGGWDLAAEALGIHARGIENMKEARATRDAAGLTTIHDDVWTYTPDGRATGLIASPPCQTFSAAGKGSGRKALDDVLAVIASGDWHSLAKLKEAGLRFGDDRTALVLTPLHFATGYEYEWLAWEQVPTVLPVWEACAEVLREMGWHVWTGLLQAEMYGVPQTRKRAFLLASRLGPVAPPTPTHSRYYSRSPEKLDEGVEKWVSMAEALGWGLEPGEAKVEYRRSGERIEEGFDPAASPSQTVTTRINRWQGKVSTGNFTAQDFRGQRGVPYERDVEAPAPTVTGNAKAWGVGWGLTDRPAPTITGGGTDAGGAEPIAKIVERWTTRPDWTDRRPRTTIVGSFRPDIVASPGYRTDISRQDAPDSVRVTVAEAGVLQSFPADYPWQGTKGKQYLQCGNAVPPLLGWHALQAAAVHHLSAEQIEGVA